MVSLVSDEMEYNQWSVSIPTIGMKASVFLRSLNQRETILLKIPFGTYIEAVVAVNALISLGRLYQYCTTKKIPCDKDMDYIKFTYGVWYEGRNGLYDWLHPDPDMERIVDDFVKWNSKRTFV